MTFPINFLKSFAKAFLKRFCFNLPCKTSAGWVKIPILRGNGLRTYWSFLHRSEEWKLDFFQRILPLCNGIFVDVGANLGQTLLLFRQIDKERFYLGFEANGNCLYYINALIEANHLKLCSFVALGLADTNGLCKLYLRKGVLLDSGATVVYNLRPERNYEAIYVPLFRYDSIAKILALGPPGLIKIDVEGGELSVLKGLTIALQTQRPLILCEVLFTDPKADLAVQAQRNKALASLLKDHQYVIWQLAKSKDGRRIQGVKLIDRFESDYYSPQNADLCDYLFVPSESSEKVKEALTYRI